METDFIRRNFEQVREQIARAEQASGRSPGSVQLCAVSKFHPQAMVLAALAEGQFLFGENRVQEAVEKFSTLPPDVRTQARLHIIGSLQTNKVKKAVQNADCIQSVDRDALLAEIEKQCALCDKVMPVFFELHTAEESKSGYADVAGVLHALERCAAGAYPHVRPSGVMTMAPLTDDEALIRRSFAEARSLLETAQKEFPQLPLTELSMGMSADYALAIAEGSTMVRIGTALFGSRS